MGFNMCMDAKRSVLAPFVLAMLVFLAVAILWHARVTSARSTVAPPHIITGPSRLHLSDFRLYGKHGKLIHMNASAYYYQTLSGTFGSTQNASTFTTAAPNLCDLSVGDTVTGYPCPLNPGFPNVALLYALIDLGSPQPVTKWEVMTTGGISYTPALYYSNDGVAWTNADVAANITGGTSRTFSTITARYWQVSMQNISAVTHLTATDYRLYDGTGTIYGPPGGGSTWVDRRLWARRNSQIF